MRWWCCVVALWVGHAAAAELLDRVVAVVNKEVILWSELQEMLAPVAEAQLRGVQGEERTVKEQALRNEALELLIGQQLLEQAQERLGITVDDAEVEQAIADVARQNGLTVERLFGELERQGLGPDAYRAELRAQLLQYKFMNMQIRARVQVDEAEVRNRFNQQRGALAAEGWRLQRLMLKVPAEVEVETVVAEADALRARIVAGEDFAELARARSDDATTREAGGLVGVVAPKDLSATFREALAAVPIGVPVVVATPAAVFLLRVAESVDTSDEEYLRVRDELYRDLYDEAMEREMVLWTAEERRRAHVELKL